MHSCPVSSYPHAKVIVTFRGSTPIGMFLGSQNFSRASLEQNREIGISEPELAPAMARALLRDLPATCVPKA